MGGPLVNGATTREAPARVGARDHLVGALITAAYIVLLLVTSRDLAMSRDESFYVVAAEDYAGWFELLWTDSSAAMERGAIDTAWDYNSEHPSLMKSMFALSLLAHRHLGLFTDPGMAIRFPAIVMMSLLLWLLYVFGARAFGREAGYFAAICYAMLPQPFYHAHLDCFDAPITFMAVLVTYAYWRALSDKKWLLPLGVAYGLALATKHNAWLFPIVFLIHWIWVVLGEVSARRRKQPKIVSLFPWWLVSMAILGPPIFVGLWPWLWNDGLERFGWYANFHFSHVYYNIAYLGYTYFEPPFPMSYPWVMTLYTIPLTVTLLALLGIGARARALLPGPLAKRFWPHGAIEPDRLRTDVLFIGQLLAPMVVISMPWTPIFGGTKHWLPSYPFIALYAGVAFHRITRAIALELAPRWRRPRTEVAHPAAAVASLCAFVVLIAPCFVETISSHPFGLSHYTLPAGGVPGAADQGMNRQFWGYTQGSLAAWMTEQMPNGGTVYVCDATFKAWEMMVADHMIPANIRPSGHIPSSDFVLVHHEHHFNEVDYQTWVAFGSPKAAHVLTHFGVPIVTVYENPRRRPRPAVPSDRPRE